MADDVFEKHELPSGGWVAFRDPKLLTRKQRKPIRRAQTRIGLAMRDVVANGAPAMSVPDEDMDVLEVLMHAMAAAIIEDWSFPTEITPAALEDLQDNDYAALIRLVEPHRAALEQAPDGFEPGPREDAAGNERPTGSSEESANTSEVTPPTETFPPTSLQPGIS